MSKNTKVEEVEKENDTECHCNKEGDSCEGCSSETSTDSCNCDTCDCDSNNNVVNEDVVRLENEVLLAKAELQNYRKRKDEETHNLLRFANQDLILELLPVIDNFERAIQLDDNNLSDELSKFLTGFKMMYSHMTETLKKYGVEEITAQGQQFDSSCMEAIMTDQDKEKDNNIVLDVFVRGYRLKDRIIRPASVKVNNLED